MNLNKKNRTNKPLYFLCLLFSITIAFALTKSNTSNVTKAVANQSQVLTIVPVQNAIAPNQDLIVDINYSLLPALDIKTSGVSFRLHWDSSQFSFQSITNLLSDNLLRQSAIRLDNENFDNDLQTNVYIIFTWLDISQGWPTVGFSPKLLTANFKSTLDFTKSSLKISSVSSLPDMQQLPNTPLVWDVKSHELIIDSENIFTANFEIAPPAPSIGSQSPSYLPQNIFSGDASLCSTDIDGNGILEPLTDGVLASRFISGITGSSLVNGALGQGATRTTSAEIVTFLQISDCQSMLDIDANGVIEAGFDDVLFSRYLFGYNGNDLTESALGVDFQRDGITDLHTWFETHSYIRTITIDGTVTVGTQGISSDGSVIVEPIDNDVDVSVSTGVDQDGDLVYQVEIAGDGEVKFTFGKTVNNKSLTGCTFQDGDDEFPVNYYTWGSPNCAYYLDGIAFDFNRLPTSRMTSTSETTSEISFSLLGIGSITDLFNVKVKTSSQLTSSCSQLSNNGCRDKKPVLFIHGFSPDSGLQYTWPFSGLGGGKGTWDKFPELIEELGYTPFEFRWRTSAKFEDIAAELIDAIKLIKQQTSQEVNIIAHSFGGILTRTMMQGLAYGNPNIDNLVDKIVTVGTPHTGIADEDKCMNNKVFPGGQASYPIGMFETCQQISCHQMGEETISSIGDSRFLFDVSEPGMLMSKLACLSSENENCNGEYHPLIDGDFLVLIGLKKSQNIFTGTHTIGAGDGLISYEGQRFVPDLTRYGTCAANDIHPILPLIPLRNLIAYTNASVRERMLGTDSSEIFPEQTYGLQNSPLDASSGYKHSSPNGILNASIEEVELDCRSAITCGNSTFKYVKDFFSNLEVTIEQASTQSDPTNENTALFKAVFSKPINPTTFTSSDVLLLGGDENTAAVEVILTATTSDNTHWDIRLNYLSDGYTMIVSLPSGGIESLAGVLNQASTSSDNQITYNVQLTHPLNDTGITWGGDYPSGNSTTCTSNITFPQDCHQGRDFTHNDDSDGHAGFSFTKLDANGNDLPANATSWSCVRDNVTRLVWEVKTDDSGIHDKDHTYRWGGTTHQGSNYGTYFNDWDGLVNGTNNQILCGFNDWRLPTTQELMNLVDSSSINQFIDVDYFPNNTSSYFWTASPYASSSNYAWSVNFNLGYSISEGRGALHHVRLVR